MLVLYGERANINPPALGILGIPSHEQIYRDEQDEDEDDNFKDEDKNQQVRHVLFLLAHFLIYLLSLLTYGLSVVIDDETQCFEALSLSEMHAIVEVSIQQTYGDLHDNGDKSSPKVNDDTKTLPISDATSPSKTPTTPASVRASSFPTTFNPQACPTRHTPIIVVGENSISPMPPPAPR